MWEVPKGAADAQKSHVYLVSCLVPSCWVLRVRAWQPSALVQGWRTPDRKAVPSTRAAARVGRRKHSCLTTASGGTGHAHRAVGNKTAEPVKLGPTRYPTPVDTES